MLTKLQTRTRVQNLESRMTQWWPTTQSGPYSLSSRSLSCGSGSAYGKCTRLRFDILRPSSPHMCSAIPPEVLQRQSDAVVDGPGRPVAAGLHARAVIPVRADIAGTSRSEPDVRLLAKELEHVPREVEHRRPMTGRDVIDIAERDLSVRDEVDALQHIVDVRDVPTLEAVAGQGHEALLERVPARSEEHTSELQSQSN